MAYKAPIWEDGKSPAISAENLNNLSQAAEGAQVLYGNSAPTSSTEGAVGQFYLVVVADSDGNYPLYQCVAIANGRYVWRDTRSIPDSITFELGLPGPGTINSALNVLANIGNVHVWQRVQTYADPVPEVPAGYTLGAVETDVLLVSKAGETSVSISYSDSISVDANGNVSLASVNTISYVISEWREHYSVLQGKFCQVMDSTSGGITDAGASIFFFPSDAILEYAQAANYKLTLTAKKYQSVTGYPYTPAIPAGTHVDYLTSTDRNAYPDNATDAQDAYYTLGDVVMGSFQMAEGYPLNNVFYETANSINVGADGAIILNSPTVASFTSDGFPDDASFLGKFIRFSHRGASGSTTPPATTPPFNTTPSEVVYIPASATITHTNGIHAVDRYQPVTGHAAIPANTTITYLGQLGGGARIEVGSYVGTGTYGSSNPNTLTFGFEPKIVELLFRTSKNVGGGNLKNEDLTGNGIYRSQEFMVADRLTAEYAQGEGFGYSSSSSYGKKVLTEKRFIGIRPMLQTNVIALNMFITTSPSTERRPTMYYINAQPNASGNYGNPVSNKQEGMVALPDGLLDAYIEAKGFVTLDEVVDGGVVAFTLNQEALDAYLAEHPDQPEPTPEEAVTWASMATSIKEGVDEV